MEMQFAGMSPDEIRQQLQDNAAKIEQRDYFKPFTEDELLSAKETFTEKSIEFADVEDAFKEVKAEWTGKMKVQKLEVATIRKNIRSKGEVRNGNVYMLDDQAEGYMYIYEETGSLIEKRRLRPDEKQTSIKMRKAS